MTTTTPTPIAVEFAPDVARSMIVALEEAADRLVTVARRASRTVENEAATGKDKRPGAVKVHAMLVEADRFIDAADAVRRALEAPTSSPAAAVSSPRSPATLAAADAPASNIDDARVVAAATMLIDGLDELDLEARTDIELEVIARAADLGALDNSKVLDEDETPVELADAARRELTRRHALEAVATVTEAGAPIIPPGQDPTTGVAPIDGRTGRDDDLTLADAAALLEEELTAEPPADSPDPVGA